MNADGNKYALPSWWRFALMALATLILCSCQAMPPTAQGAEPAGAPPTSIARNVITEGPQPIPRPRTDVRSLSGDAIAASRPLNSKEIAAGWATPAPCNCACCGGGNRGNSCAPGGACEAPCYVCPEQASVGPPDEYLCDGGDFGLPADVRARWTVDGVEQEDAIAHYDTLDGRVVVTPSNRVCIYAPRFAAIRRVENPLAHERRQLIDVNVEATTPIASAEAQPVVASTQRTGVAINLGQQPPSLFRGREQAAEVVQVVAPGEFFGTVGPYALVEVLRTGQVVGSEIPAVKRIVQNAVAWNGDQGPQVVFSNQQAVAVVGLRQPGIVFQTDEPGDPRLRLIKCASTSNAQPGEDVEFMLRFDNIGDQVIGNVTIIDNLTTRLEYVPDTAKSTLAANFTSVPNGTGSTVMRWEIVEPLKPGDGGVLTFKCRVR